MRHFVIIGLSLCLMLLFGCRSRYQTFTLAEGTAHQGDSIRSRYPDSSKVTAEDINKDDLLEIKRRVLVDTKTGKLYYFEELEGPLKAFTENR